ncbi:hypothetical protein H2199_005517 [Coniosporium tulheliwenetii]|uniref:Uncharacterized protein n=1 Tax=Coniosporium tulheliwenetii TaxID=3383036 RepID=A0ACC2Z1X1_9PEZI|nr:hypothetical protein H2199_005517 [Cladosporium sp. JES 115]
MVTVAAFLVIYILGGLSLPPLAALAVLGYIYFTSLTPPTDRPLEIEPTLPTKGTNHNVKSLTEKLREHPEQGAASARAANVAAGYFAVCREYVPGGINGKPPERTTPAGDIIAPESPSVYQSMYRSIFERTKGQGPTAEAGRNNARAVRKSRNVFFVLLRHGHLMLFDDSEQLEVRHVIALAHYKVDIYGGKEVIPEGELWVKRNCIRLTRKREETLSPDTKPFFLFSDNCSEKEDFYFALLQNQEPQAGDTAVPPLPLTFDPAHIIKLIQQLHASKENFQTRWINALIGRLFLALYRTPQVEDFIRMKITKKIARVSKPAFLTSVKIQKIDMGDCAPLVTNPKLRELTIDGDLTIETDVSYKGNFRLEIAAVARIELGSHFKAREVNLLLAGILKKLDGHLLLRVKPPPSNRVWISFETMPDMELSIEPVVSSRQITYGVILRAIESRIREVVSETLVLPNWDDAPFLETSDQQVRGGIWKNDPPLKAAESGNVAAPEQDPVEQTVSSDDSDVSLLASRGNSLSVPDVAESLPEGISKRRAAQSTLSLDGAGEKAAASGVQVRPRAKKPKAIRSASFSGSTSPVVSVDPATVDAVKDSTARGQQDAASRMRGISLRSPPTSPIQTHHESLTEAVSGFLPAQSAKTSVPKRKSVASSIASSETVSTAATSSTTEPNTSHPAASPASAEKRTPITRPLAAAKSWLQNRQPRVPSPAPSNASSSPLKPPPSSRVTADAKPADPAPQTNDTNTPPTSRAALSQPIGRGQPLPPPGMPLPPPPRTGRSAWTISPLANIGMGIAKRRPVPPPPLPRRGTPSQGQGEGRRESVDTAATNANASGVRAKDGAGRRMSAARAQSLEGKEEVLLVPAPEAEVPEGEEPPSQVSPREAAEEVGGDERAVEREVFEGRLGEAEGQEDSHEHGNMLTVEQKHDGHGNGSVAAGGAEAR